MVARATGHRLDRLRTGTQCHRIYCSLVSNPSSPTPRRRLLVSCGEPSGDLYAGELVRHLRERAGPLDVFGLGGDRVAAQDARLVAHVNELAVVGLVEVVRHLRRLRRVFRSVLAEVDREPPAHAVGPAQPVLGGREAGEQAQGGRAGVGARSDQVLEGRGALGVCELRVQIAEAALGSAPVLEWQIRHARALHAVGYCRGAENRSESALDAYNQIVALYGLLAQVAPSPVIELNRAVAVAMRDGPAAGLELVDAILEQGDLDNYHLAHATRADLCRRLGRTAEARVSYERALMLAQQEPERRFLEKRLVELD